MRSTRRRWLQCLLAAALLPFTLAAQEPLATLPVPRFGQAPAPQPVRVLFIGNSYTYVNNLPEMFKALADPVHFGVVEVGMAAAGGWRLKDHWESAETHAMLRRARWDFVVLQEQSTLGANLYVDGKTRVGGDDVFRTYAGNWAAEIRRAGARPVFYLTWARKATPEDQAALNAAYVRAAKENRATLAPVGIAWSRIRNQWPAIEMFASDGSHPSAAGSYLAACVLVATIFGRTPEGLPAKVTGRPVNVETGQIGTQERAVLADLSRGDAKVLQAEAWNTWREQKRNGGYPAAPPVTPPTVAPLPIAASPRAGGARQDDARTRLPIAAVSAA